MPRTLYLDASILTAALTGLEAKAARLDEQIAQVRSMLGRRRPGRPAATPVVSADKSSTTAPLLRKRRRLSPAARNRIADAQKKRWAKTREEQAEAAKKAAHPAKPAKKLATKKAKAINKAPLARPTKRPVKKVAPKAKAPTAEQTTALPLMAE